jgi:hypothetical protein
MKPPVAAERLSEIKLVCAATLDDHLAKKLLTVYRFAATSELRP